MKTADIIQKIISDSLNNKLIVSCHVQCDYPIIDFLGEYQNGWCNVKKAKN